MNDWVNNREAGDLRRHRGHYDVIVMFGSHSTAKDWDDTLESKCQPHLPQNMIRVGYG